jgi:uncharacterized protein YbjT (DUF2867 family)
MRHDHLRTGPVTALVRPASDAGRLESRGVQIARGDMLDVGSLVAATPQVPHFWHKKLAEDKLEQLGVPFVALRPGAFLDQVATMAGNPLDKGRLIWMSKATVSLTFVHTSDLAAYLAAAVGPPGRKEDQGVGRPLRSRPHRRSRRRPLQPGGQGHGHDVRLVQHRTLRRRPPPPGAAVRPRPHGRGRPRSPSARPDL